MIKGGEEILHSHRLLERQDEIFFILVKGQTVRIAVGRDRNRYLFVGNCVSVELAKRKGLFDFGLF